MHIQNFRGSVAVGDWLVGNKRVRAIIDGILHDGLTAQEASLEHTAITMLVVDQDVRAGLQDVHHHRGTRALQTKQKYWPRCTRAASKGLGALLENANHVSWIVTWIKQFFCSYSHFADTLEFPRSLSDSTQVSAILTRPSEITAWRQLEKIDIWQIAIRRTWLV